MCAISPAGAFGVRLTDVCVEIKGRKLLKRKTFRHAGQAPRIEDLEEKRKLCHDFLMKGYRELRGGKPEPRKSEEFAAYGQSVLDFVYGILDICAKYRVKVFASIVNPSALRVDSEMLRKDYSFLFERYFYYLEGLEPNEMGIIVFDELEKAQCRILINQMEKYFSTTSRGYLRSARIIPEPFFVHSDLTTAIQIVDIIAYCLNWSIRLNRMDKPIREELLPFANYAFELRYIGKRVLTKDKGEEPVYGIIYIDDLRPRGSKV